MHLRFEETEHTRNQEFAVRWSGAPDNLLREFVRQQWNFSPEGSICESENYEVNLNAVSVLELSIDPDRGAGEAYATLSAWHLA
jgi:hypothetical protein